MLSFIIVIFNSRLITMKKGKVILTLAAFAVTAISVLSFKALRKTTHNRIYGRVDVSNINSCMASTCFTNINGNNPGPIGAGILACHTLSHAITVFTAPGGSRTWWTSITPGQQCTHPYAGNWTKNN